MDRRRMKRILAHDLPKRLAEDEWLRGHMSKRRHRERVTRGSVQFAAMFGLPETLPAPPAAPQISGTQPEGEG